MTGKTCVHGHSERESERLSDLAQTLTALLHDDTPGTRRVHVN